MDKIQNEPLTLVEWKTGIETGESAPRWKAHREGLAHLAMHLWVYSVIDGQGHILFQRRSFNKPNYPGYFAASIGGHVGFGEGIQAIIREANEEIGLVIKEDDIISLGKTQHCFIDHNYHDYEWVQQHITCSNQALTDYRFVDGEVIGIIAMSQSSLKALADQDQQQVTCPYFDGVELSDINVHKNQIVANFLATKLAQQLARFTP